MPTLAGVSRGIAHSVDPTLATGLEVLPTGVSLGKVQRTLPITRMHKRQILRGDAMPA